MARDAAGNRTTSSGVTVTVSNLSPAPPPVPGNLTAQAGSPSRIDLSWTASDGAAGYHVYRGEAKIASVTGTAYSDTGLTPNTGYGYAVAAYNANGSSANSTTAYATTWPPLSTQFTIGDRVRAATYLTVRQTPSTSGSPMGSQRSGSKGMVSGGPVYADGDWWWNINFDRGADGWVNQINLAKVRLRGTTEERH